MKLHREPDFVIGSPDAPYLRRWHLIPKNKWFNIYLHHILKSDDDRALHDHPWINMSIVLKGGYWEIMPYSNKDKVHVLSCKWRWPGSVVFRLPSAAHRLKLEKRPKLIQCWSLFITGPRVREWGFHCPNRWVHWREFLGLPEGEPTGAERGKGCGEVL